MAHADVMHLDVGVHPALILLSAESHLQFWIFLRIMYCLLWAVCGLMTKCLIGSARIGGIPSLLAVLLQAPLEAKFTMHVAEGGPVEGFAAFFDVLFK